GRLGERERVRAIFRYDREVDPDKALAPARERWARHPQCLACGVWLTWAASDLERWDECLKTIGQVRALDGASSVPRIDRLEATCTAGKGDRNRALEIARHGITLARAQGARSELARLRMVEGRIAAESQVHDAVTAFAEAHDLFVALHDRPALLEAIEQSHELFARTGELGAALRLLDEQEQLERAIGRHDTGAIDRDRGWIMAQRGELDAGRAKLDRAYELMKPYGNTLDLRFITHHLERQIQRMRGDLPGALKTVEEDLAFVRDKGWPNREQRQLCGHLIVVARDLMQADRMSEARADLDEASTFDPSDSDKADITYEKARLALYTDHPAEAESLARVAAEGYEGIGQPVELAMTRAVLARALLAQGKLDEAFVVAEKAKAVGERLELLEPRVDVLVAHGLVQGWTNAVLGLPTLDRACDDARKAGVVPALFEAELARGQVLLRDGKTAEGRALLVQLEKDARARGWMRIARLAAAAAK
ncbi:MAG TPA: hypothetical protein VLT45_25615, partial [Kofleriaceae bacterium]|nr:hypothetical protein [Kofleriaceae bacterium]